MRRLPTGTVTLLFTDIEGSTRMLQELGEDRYVEALTIHRELLRRAFTDHGGVEVDTQGDSFLFSFETVRAAVCASAAGQRALASFDWPSEPIRVRIGLHTGEPLVRDGLYAGLDVHRAARVMSAAHGGQVLLSARTADLISGEPPDDLAVRDLGAHRLKDLLEPQRLYQLEGDGLEREFPPLKTLSGAISNLPIQPSPLIGRERELADLLELLRGGARVVTLIGAGGTGKTRLALQVAAELVDDFADGVYWVPLAGLRDAALVVPTVEQTLGAKEDLAQHIGSKRMLLLLDNFEQVLAAARELAEVAAHCPNLTLLVTSRAPLRVAAEREYALEPMVEEEAAALFRARAHQTAPEEVVRDICARVDGLPLAIELAAARTRLLSPADLLARLEQRLPLLTGGGRDVPERQRTLRETIAWSYELLDQEQQGLFRRLGVFARSFDVEAAEAVCDAELLDLEALLEQSLVRRWSSGRLGLLETVREFSCEQLDLSGEGEETRARHAEHLMNLAERGDPELRDANQVEWLNRFRAETDNIRAALDFASSRGDLVTEARLAGGCWYFWYLNAMPREGRDRLRSAIRRPEALPEDVRATVLEGLSAMELHLGNLDEAETLIEHALTIRRRLGQPRPLMRALMNRALVAQANREAALADGLFDECAALADSVEDNWFAGIARANRGTIYFADGDFVRARTLFEEGSVRLGERDPLMRLALQANLAWAEFSLEDDEAARATFRSVLDESRQVEYREVTAWCLVGLGSIEARGGDAARAARFLAAADAIAAETGSILPPMEADARAHALELVGERGGGTATDVAAGAKTADAAVAEALES